jgi:hypothetical protein
MRHIPAKSVVVGRKPRIGENEFKTAFIKVYLQKNPLTLDDFPDEEVDFANIEQITFSEPPKYYLEGNDLVFDDILGVDVTQTGTALHIVVVR